MDQIKRQITKAIEERLFKEKAIVLYGPRRAGKTTLCKHILAKHASSKYFLCDNPDVKEALTDKTATELRNFIGNTNLVVLDEAQNILNIGTTLKLLVDTYPELQIIATGSSSFDLANHLVEPLTGRKYEFELFPLSYQEIVAHNGELEAKRNLERMMIYGLYPDIYLSPQESAQELIEEIKSSYLFKDILTYNEVKNSDALTKLLQMLALQIGSEVSYSELSRSIGIDIKTVKRYIDLLEKIFVIKILPALSRNMRTEISKSRKIYFYDLGIRNALIRNFNPLEIRNDAGGLFENFCVMEMLKNISNARKFANFYFWRTWQQQEVDFIVEADGQMHAYEFKLNKIHTSMPKSFHDLYPKASWKTIHRGNINELLISRL
ncbi:MAG: ATP-binding protein [Candidatus Peregrinibacteria bacterium]|nr:ATP-binding protein [Candidatus Peregrinibacteria bacterium]MDZ4245379.1 ATP-binding protein [Candidatus Gracilibacteria bacterium]